MAFSCIVLIQINVIKCPAKNNILPCQANSRDKTKILFFTGHLITLISIAAIQLQFFMAVSSVNTTIVRYCVAWFTKNCRPLNLRLTSILKIGAQLHRPHNCPWWRYTSICQLLTRWLEVELWVCQSLKWEFEVKLWSGWKIGRLISNFDLKPCYLVSMTEYGGTSSTTIPITT